LFSYVILQQSMNVSKGKLNSRMENREQWNFVICVLISYSNNQIASVESEILMGRDYSVDLRIYGSISLKWSLINNDVD